MSLGDFEAMMGGIANQRSRLESTLEDISAFESERHSRERAMQEAIVNGSAEKVCTRLRMMIEDFEQDLDQSQQVGVRLVSFGSEVKFAVTALGWANPSLVFFEGVWDGKPVQLVQHVSQLSFLLMAVPLIDPTVPRRPIGFCATSDDDVDPENEDDIDDDSGD